MHPRRGGPPRGGATALPTAAARPLLPPLLLLVLVLLRRTRRGGGSGSGPSPLPLLQPILGLLRLLCRPRQHVQAVHSAQHKQCYVCSRQGGRYADAVSSEPWRLCDCTQQIALSAAVPAASSSGSVTWAGPVPKVG